MIRGDFTFDPTTKYEQKGDSEFNRSLKYLKGFGSLNSNVLTACKIAKKAIYLSPRFEILSPIASPISKILGKTGRLIKIAKFILAAQKLNFSSPVGEILGVTGKGISMATWLADVLALGLSVRTLSVLESTSLTIGLLCPMIGLISHLREEGTSAFSGVALYKTSYEVGLGLLAVYLYFTAVTLSMQVDLLIMGTGFALSFV